MQDTLTALHAAIIETPADRTVRLVYADALDESGEPANAIRAEFIRAQVAIEAMADDDPQRVALAAQCTERFAANWIGWWQPVCAALDLPQPYVPGHGLGARLLRSLSGEKREPGAPYIAYSNAWSVRSEQHGFTAQFIAGFPELLAIHNYTSDIVTAQLAAWLSATPVCRLRFTQPVMGFNWSRVNRPHLAKLTELTFDMLSPDGAACVAQCQLHGLTSLRVGPIHPAAEVARSLVHNPPWKGLRSIALLGTCAPDAIHTLATNCTLTELDELSFAVGGVPPPLPITGFVGAIGAMAMEMIGRVFDQHPTPPGPITGQDYWPALDELAHSPLFRQLRCLRIKDADPRWLDRAAQALFQAQVTEVEFEPFLSDACVRTLADRLNRDKLERLELPRTRISPAMREELSQRFGTRFVLT